MQKDISADQGSCDDPADSATPPDRRAAYHTLDAALRPRRMCRIPSEKYHRRPACVFMVAGMASRRILALIEDHATIRRTLPRPRTGEAPIILWTPIYGHDGCVGYRAKSIIGDPPVFFMVASMASRRILALIKDHATIRRTRRSCPDRRGAYHTLDADLRPRRVCRIPSEKYHRRPACVLYGSEHGQQRDISAGRGSCDDPADSAKLPGQARRLSYFGRRFTAAMSV